MESNILYENQPFYAYRTKAGIELRKNVCTHSYVVGIVPTLERAKRFIDRAVKYPHNF